MIKTSLPIPPEIMDCIPEHMADDSVMFEIVFIENEEKNIGTVRTGDYCLACMNSNAYDISFPKICGVLEHIGKTMDSWMPARALHYFRAIHGITPDLRPSSYSGETQTPETIPHGINAINQLSWQDSL